jgi:DNA-binding transcriptional MerR regulator
MIEKAEQIEYFGSKRAAELSQLTLAMVHYLARQRLLVPTGDTRTGRGRPRRYTFQDIVMLRVLSRLLKTGLEVTRFRKGLKRLRRKIALHEVSPESIRYLLTDGRDVFVQGQDGSLESLTQANQLAFSFLIDIQATRAEILEALRNISDDPQPKKSQAPAKKRQRR